MILKRVHESEDSLGLTPGDPYMLGGDHCDLFAVTPDPARSQRVPYGGEGPGRAAQVPMLAVLEHVAAAARQDDVNQIVFGSLIPGHQELSGLFEHPVDRSVFSEVPPVLGEQVANVADRAVSVVSRHLNEDRHSAGGIALIARFFDPKTGEVAGALLDRTINVVAGNISGLRLVDGQPQPGIELLVATADAGGHGDLLE